MPAASLLAGLGTGFFFLPPHPPQTLGLQFIGLSVTAGTPPRQTATSRRRTMHRLWCVCCFPVYALFHRFANLSGGAKDPAIVSAGASASGNTPADRLVFCLSNMIGSTVQVRHGAHTGWTSSSESLACVGRSTRTRVPCTLAFCTRPRPPTESPASVLSSAWRIRRMPTPVCAERGGAGACNLPCWLALCTTL